MHAERTRHDWQLGTTPLVLDRNTRMQSNPSQLKHTACFVPRVSCTDCVSGSRREPLDRGGRQRFRGLPQLRAVHGATDASVRQRSHHSERIERCCSSMCPSSTMGKRRFRSRKLGTQIGRAPVTCGGQLSTPKVAILIQVKYLFHRPLGYPARPMNVPSICLPLKHLALVSLRKISTGTTCPKLFARNEPKISVRFKRTLKILHQHQGRNQ